ncbi:unnamed protein product [Cuscuta campestris]|uniref:Peptidase A2 domain-containing protein n=1 Tax=Cuscuta campestris TaxID=132261 RepID=A0A484LE17_9ASTE|nr:unnamed protein product [Cuscuta campestris]
MVQTHSNANAGVGAPHQGENSATGGQHPPPITTVEAEALIQRVGITAEQFKEVLAVLTPNREIVVGDVAGGPTGGKAGPTGSQEKRRKPQVKKAPDFAFERLQDTRSARKGDLRDTLKEKRGESTATSKTGSEERRRAVEDKGAAELWRMYEQLEKRLDAQNPYRQAVFSGPPVAEGKKRKDYGKGPNPTGYHANRHPVHAVQSLPAPPHRRESYGVQDAPKYCEYHRNSTHNTSECVTLKKEMDQLIARGPPPRSERPSSSNRTWSRPAAPTAAITAGEGQEDERRHLGRDCDDLDEEERQGRRHLGCRFIMGGNTGGDSVSSRKKWKNIVHLAEVQRPPLPKRKKKEPLIFTDEDYPPVLSPHKDALVIKVEINNVVVHRTLVDTGSSVNVMYSNTFKELGLSRSNLKPIHTPLSGFTGDTIEAEGTITVKSGVGDDTHRLWIDMEFMVVQLDCAQHLILGRPGMEDLECVISPVHLCLKFNTPTGVGVAKGNQSLSRSCYVRATKSHARVDENVSTICAAIQKEEG